jgi:chlorobactene glucosyltransferase
VKRDALGERLLDGLAHLCALVGLAYAARAATIARGWLRVPVVATLPDAPALSVVVPARDEARSIERCVRSLLAQTIEDLELIVVDDRSADETPAILERLAREDRRLRVVRGAALPEGWVGKPWALAQGARAARGEWLLFTDADTWHAPEACSSTLAFALARGADALSLATYQELGTAAERAVLPAILGMILIACGPMDALNDPSLPEHALANGQYLLVSRQAYDALGGHEALRDALVEDVEFARRIKGDGRYRLLLAGGEEIVRVRMYRSLHEIWDGFTKNMFAAAHGDLRALAGAAVVLSALSVVPAGLALDAAARRRPVRACEALLCLATGMAVAARGFRFTRLPLRLAWWAPVGYAFCGAVVLNSTLRVLSGRGVEWRGRRYTGRFGDVGKSSPHA